MKPTTASLFKHIPIRVQRQLQLLLLVTIVTFSPRVMLSDETGEASRGQQVYMQCRECHEIGNGATNGIGPHLNQLFGRVAGGIDGFHYSPSFINARAEGLVWNVDSIAAYLEDPQSYIEGTRMNYPGLRDKVQRDELIAFLRLFSDDSDGLMVLDSYTNAPGFSLDPDLLEIEGDREYGEYLSSLCTTCHQLAGEDAGIPAIINWPERAFVAAMHAYKNHTRPNPVMQIIAERLSDEEIAALAAYFADPQD